MPLLSDINNVEKKYTKNTHYWHYPFNVIYNSPYEPYALTPHSVIRKGDYKLIFDWYGRLHLYQIAEDPFEENDLATTMPELTDQLFEELMGWLKKNVAQRYWPSVNEKYHADQEVRKVAFKDMFSSYLAKPDENK